MGATIEIEEAGNLTGSVTSYACALHGTVVEAAEIPSLDEVPILAVAAAAAHGTTRFRDVGELRVKESDRLSRHRRAGPPPSGSPPPSTETTWWWRAPAVRCARPGWTPAATTGWPWPPRWPGRPARRRRLGPIISGWGTVATSYPGLRPHPGPVGRGRVRR